jgi:hypothetical protein
MKQRKQTSKWSGIIIGFGLGIIACLVFVFWHQAFPKDTVLDLQTLGLWLSVFGTIVALIFVAINANKQTAKQIQNQNKQMHRPYLMIEKTPIGGSKYEFELRPKNYYKNLIVNKENEGKPHKVDKTFEIKNWGQGVATKILLYNYYDGKWGAATKQKQKDIEANDLNSYKFDYIDPIDPVEGNRKIKFNIDYTKSPLEYVYVIILYSDIHDNIYKVMLEIKIDEKQNITYRQYEDDRKSYEVAVAELNIKEDRLVEAYDVHALNLNHE